MTAGHQFTLSAFGDEIAADLAEQLDVMQREDIPALEFRAAWGTNILDLSDDQVRQAKGLLDARGMHVSAIGSPTRPRGPAPRSTASATGRASPRRRST